MFTKLPATFSGQILLAKLSIRSLTLLGFSLVAIPLVIALLFSANKLTQLSKQSSIVIFDVAQLVQLNRELSDALVSIERSASQYLVLKDNELHHLFIKKQQALADIISAAITQQKAQQQSTAPKNSELSSLLKQLGTGNNQVKQMLNTSSIDSLSLEQLQQQFKQLFIISNKIEKHSDIIIAEQAKNIHQTGEQVSNNILKSLYIIPITGLIAFIFIVLITKPLKLLIEKIQHLEQGNFEQEITFEGTIEVKEIAEALETMRKRLHSLELQKSSFIRHISHELKTPLAAIREGTELIYDNSVGSLNDEQQEICHIIKDSVNRLQRLIEDLLDFNIVLDSTSLQDAERINLSLLIDAVIEQRKLEIKRKDLTIENSSETLFLYCNAKQLSVVVENLLSNAIKYSPQNASIAIEYTVFESQLSLAIADQGPGISDELKDKVFDAFYQGPPAKDSQIKGSGLGLTIVKELLMRLNGNILITNNNAAINGTCITIQLPNVIKDGVH